MAGDSEKANQDASVLVTVARRSNSRGDEVSESVEAVKVEAVKLEAQERRESDRVLSAQLDRLRTEIVTTKEAMVKVSADFSQHRRRAKRNHSTLTEGLDRLNRRALAIALAAVLAALGSIPEARALAVAIAKGLMHF